MPFATCKQVSLDYSEGWPKWDKKTLRSMYTVKGVDMTKAKNGNGLIGRYVGKLTILAGNAAGVTS